MAKIQFNEFTQHSLTHAEEEQACSYNQYQIMGLQNERAIAASTLLKLKVDLQNPEVFTAQHADLSGRIELLTYLIDQSCALQDIPNPYDPTLTELEESE